MNTDACKPVGEGADAPNVRLHRKEQDVSKQEATRLAFDRWCQDNGHGTLDDMVSPLDRSLRALMWSAWQAARRWPDGEPVAFALRFAHDKRLNLSTVFDTLEEAQDYASRCTGSIEVVPLFTAPPAKPDGEPVAFDHGIGAGRFNVVKGAFWWHIRIGNSTANVGKFHSKRAAEDMALKLLTAFRDGAFLQSKVMSAPPDQSERIAERKWLDNECLDGGCQSLKWRERIAALEAVIEQTRVALERIRHATAPTHDDGGHHEAAHDLSIDALRAIEEVRK